MYQRAEWQFSPCEPRGRGQEPCHTAAVTVGMTGGTDMSSPGADRLPETVTPGLEADYSPQNIATTDTEKKSCKRKRELTGESYVIEI